MFSKYLSKFPYGYNPSDAQVKLIKEIEKAFNDGYRFVIASAPTGTGKSFVPRTLGNVSARPTPAFKSLINSYAAYAQDFAGNYTNEAECLSEPSFGTFALTITKQLQDQYKKLFDDIDVLKGKQNYLCDIDDSFDVDTAPCTYTKNLKQECWGKGCCNYYTNRNHALTSQFSVLNYKMFLSLPGHVKRKNFLICDEASELEEELVRRFSAHIDYTRLNLNNVEHTILKSDKYDVQYRWLTNLIFNITETIESLTSRNSNKVMTLSQPEAARLKYLRNLHGNLSTVEQTWHKCEYIVDFTKNGVSFTPLKVNNLSNSLFDYGDNILLMSATITDHASYAKTLGIKRYKYIETPSAFDPNKSPIYMMKEPVLNYSNLQKNLPKIARYCQAIADNHPNEKGIIHTHSLDICRYLQERLKGDRFLFREDSANNEKLLESHYATDKPTVLVSPSLTFGTDLNGDKGRFQIIVKTPYPPLGNKRIKKMADLDPDWYQQKTLSAFIQTTGRCTRSKADYSVTYVIDGKARKLLLDNKDKLPEHLSDRLK